MMRKPNGICVMVKLEVASSNALHDGLGPYNLNNEA